MGVSFRSLINPTARKWSAEALADNANHEFIV